METTFAEQQDYIFVRFYEELNDFLPPRRRKKEFMHPISDRAAIKDVIESLGVPHTEVDLILVNQQSVDFAYMVQANDRISVYPVFETFDISPLTRLRPRPLREPRFVLDVHLGKLAVYLRFWGFDTWYRNDCADEELAWISADQQRILLTRDRELLKRRIVTRGYYVRSTDPKQQLAEVSCRFQLSQVPLRFIRCTQCNTRLTAIAKERVLSRLPERTRRYYQQFSYCPTCDKVYWKGSHYHNMRRRIQQIIN